MYHRILEAFRTAKPDEEQRYKMFLIKGEARQGKTRVLDEIVYTTPEDIPVNRFKLTKADQKVVKKESFC